MKKAFAIVLITAFLITVVLPAPLIAAKEATTTMLANDDDASKYVDLKGEWNFKLYRRYDRMFQYFFYYPSDMTRIPHVVWEDLDTALLPEYDVWSTWEKVVIPHDDVYTGGLLPIVREDGSAFFPSWSEAWFTRNFVLPADFTTDATVTLLLGTIDDNDVVYINGQLVEASGFIDGNRNKTLNIPSIGGFDYGKSVPSNQVKFETSYWQVQREYTIPASVLKLGQTNEIAVRLYNNNGYGGFYSGKPMALCGNDLAVRAVKGLPTTKVDSPELDATIAKQIQALQTGDINLYAETVADNYNNNGANKQSRLAEIQAYFDKYTNIVVTDTNTGYYQDSQNNIWYSARRTMTGFE